LLAKEEIVFKKSLKKNQNDLLIFCSGYAKAKAQSPASTATTVNLMFA
jgi:hypothetical protein